MTSIPRDLWPDVTLPLLADPYRFISRKARRLGTQAFRSRLLGTPALFMTGPEAAAFFYARGRFHRKGAIPERIAHVLFGDGGVQRLDGDRHMRRKALWLELMNEDALDDLDTVAGRTWEAARPELASMSAIDLFEQSARLLSSAVCSWAGVPVHDGRISDISEMLSSLFLHAASLGPSHLTGRENRKRATIWARGLVRNARQKRTTAGKDVVGKIAFWPDEDGQLLSDDAAATELLNVLRPVVAVAVYVTFLGMALHRHPEYRAPVAEDSRIRDAFVQEVRRLYPFFPAVAACAATASEWNGEVIAPGTRAVLDLYGTSRDPRAWHDPEHFLPERFLGWQGDPWTMIPQGGGEHAVTHRCPGEWITIRLMRLHAHRLALSRYDVATPEARPNYRAAPALPRGGFQIVNFRPV